MFRPSLCTFARYSHLESYYLSIYYLYRLRDLIFLTSGSLLSSVSFQFSIDGVLLHKYALLLRINVTGDDEIYGFFCVTAYSRMEEIKCLDHVL
jgi:hypothetical protein